MAQAAATSRHSTSLGTSPSRLCRACRPITARPSICAAGTSAARRSPGRWRRTGGPATYWCATASNALPSPGPASAASSSRRRAGCTRAAMRLVHRHGRRLRAQPRPRRRPLRDLRAEPLRVGDGDEPPDARLRDRRSRPQGAGLRFGPAHRLQGARRNLRARLTSTAGSAFQAPPAGSASATRSA